MLVLEVTLCLQAQGYLLQYVPYIKVVMQKEAQKMASELPFGRVMAEILDGVEFP